jgi:hypothetical protein
MERYKKEIDGKTVIKALNKIVVIKDGMATYNPTEEMVLNDGWVEYVEPVVEPTDEELLSMAKESAIERIKAHDESSEVNNCIIIRDGVRLNYWADKHERDSLKSAVRDCIALGRTEYRLDLREFGMSMSIPCELLLKMLSALEVYAIDCYNKTTDHLFAVQTLDNVDAVESYDYHKGYPSILVFNI